MGAKTEMKLFDMGYHHTAYTPADLSEFSLEAAHAQLMQDGLYLHQRATKDQPEELILMVGKDEALVAGRLAERHPANIRVWVIPGLERDAWMLIASGEYHTTGVYNPGA
jgi:hypothetical protein